MAWDGHFRMTLDAWQERLQNHFRSLREIRRLNSIFALEHNLDESETKELGREIHTHLVKASPSHRHWLPWVVYSTEVGYKYSGEEYWQTFAKSTPGWVDHHDNRSFIRAAFNKFHNDFQAAKPSGRWADAFSIICWPITHAILPQDLQRQLAEILYDLRDHYTLEMLRSPVALGQQIDAFSWRASSRFQKLADEHGLVGQIAAALLHDIDGQDLNLILPSTLIRITKDLERERSSRQWLSSAQTRAARLNLHGLNRDHDDEEDDSVQGETEYRKTVVELGLEPRLLLFPERKGHWDVRLELTDLSRLLGKFPNLKPILSGERCLVKGVKGPPLARGALLYGSREVALSSWPSSNDVLLKFENSTAELDFLLTTDCLLRPGPHWLFKVLNEGIAVEIKTRIMRPGSRYIVVNRSQSDVAKPGIFSSPVVINCEGVDAFEIGVPETISEIYSDELRQLGFQTSESLSVRPVGVAAANWDDDGFAEWLTTDSPLLAIETDRELSGMILNLVGPTRATVEIPETEIKSHTYVDLGPLDPGRYKLHLITQAKSASGPKSAGTLAITIRSPRTVQGPETKSTPFRVMVSPATPSLEQLWAGEASIELLGPKGRKAGAKIEFFRDANFQDLLLARDLPPSDLPCENQAWQEKLDTARGDVKVQNACSEATLCRIRIWCDELGEFLFCCEREFAPFRWVLRHENNGYWLHLDQYEAQANMLTYHYSYEEPTRITISQLTKDTGFRVADDGGLFVAEASAYTTAILVPPHISSFAELNLNLNVSASLATEKDMAQFLKTLTAWSVARTTGDPLTRMRREKVVLALVDRIVTTFCGGDWIRIEHRLKDSPNYLWDLRLLVAKSPRHGNVGTALFENQSHFVAWNRAELREFVTNFVDTELDLPVYSKVAASRKSAGAWIIELAIRMMSEPETVLFWAGQDFSDGIRYLYRNPVLARLARFVQLLRTAQKIPRVLKQPIGVG